VCGHSGVELTVVPPFMTEEGTVVSSSRVRAALVQGDIRAATRLLGRPYRLRGLVGHGQRRGRTIGFPTANLEHIQTLIPGNGVYAVRAWHHDVAWPAAANIGPNPTFGESAHKVEVHLIGFDGDLTSQGLAVDFVDRLRETRTFAGVEALTEQLKKDVEAARRIVGEPSSRTNDNAGNDLRN